MSGAPGRLVVVGTPLGNLDDLSPRAVAALRDAGAIACEDTRRTGRLLAAAGVPVRELLVVNEHTERRMAVQLAARIEAGETVVLVSDAGMPGVSDPGEIVVRAVVDAGGAVTVVPGPTAATAALAASGLPSSRWVFEGFLPRKGSARRTRLDELSTETRTAVLYEAPHRVVRTIDDLRSVSAPDRPVALGRELTKLHEEFVRGTLDEVIAWLRAHEPRGEYVIVLGGAAPPKGPSDDALRAALAIELEHGASTRDAVAAVTDRFRVSKRRVYDLAIPGPRSDS